jgi:hypothetical protein
MISAIFDNGFTKCRETWQNRKRVLSVPMNRIGHESTAALSNALGEWEEERIVGDALAIAGYEWCPLCKKVCFLHRIYERNPLLADLPLALTECDGCKKYFCYQSDDDLNRALVSWATFI